jgi:PEGA domain
MHSRVLCLVTLLSGVVLASLTSIPLNAQSAETPAAKNEVQDAAAGNTAKTSEQTSDQDATPEKRKFHWRLGGVSVGAGYSHFSGPYYYPYAYPYGYAPFGLYPGDWVAASFWYPIASPYPFYGPGAFGYGDGRGEVRLTAEPKAAEVYIDGGYAGTADKLKTLWLDPGAYDLTVSAEGREPFHQRLYVLSGKSLKITAKLNPEQPKEQP